MNLNHGTPRPIPSPGAEELQYAEFLMLRDQLLELRSLPAGVSSIRSDREQRELTEFYAAFEHHTAMADLVFEELQRRLRGLSERDTADSTVTNVLAFRRRA